MRDEDGFPSFFFFPVLAKLDSLMPWASLDLLPFSIKFVTFENWDDSPLHF